MREGRPSRTAVWVAAWRGLGSFDVPLVCADPVARDLVPEPYAGVLRVAARMPRATTALVRAADFISGGLTRHLPLRTRAIDDAVASDVARGTRQIVLLGAGLDARAHRLRALEGCSVFEVDATASQAQKRGKTSGLPTLAARLVYVPVDFVKEDVATALATAGHDDGAPSVFIWEGVTMYLPLPAIDRTLASLARAGRSGSLLLSTYYTTETMFLARFAPPFFALAGEPLTTRFDRDEIARRFATFGFNVESDEGDREWSLRYVGVPCRVAMSERLVRARRRPT